MKTKKTITDNTVDPDILRYTVGDDVVLDLALAKWDCMGTAAHVTMLSEMKGLKRPVVTKAEAAKVRKALAAVVKMSDEGRFVIRDDDQDVHMAVERLLTEKLGDLGKKIHTGRSRNDQVAVDVRLHMKDEILAAEGEVCALAAELCYFGWCAGAIPLVGRTHLQPAMPSSVEMWATGHAEMILDQIENLEAAYRLADLNPLGSAAGYGVPLPLDRARTTKLLGFARTVHNCFGASMARGECEAALLSALAQLMAVLSRLAEDMILFSMPEFAYFRLPREYCTGSSIMPQKFNPDVLELPAGLQVALHEGTRDRAHDAQDPREGREGDEGRPCRVPRRLHARRVRDGRGAQEGRGGNAVARRVPRGARQPRTARRGESRRGGLAQEARGDVPRNRPRPLPRPDSVRRRVRRVAPPRARRVLP